VVLLSTFLAVLIDTGVKTARTFDAAIFLAIRSSELQYNDEEDLMYRLSAYVGYVDIRIDTVTFPASGGRWHRSYNVTGETTHRLSGRFRLTLYYLSSFKLRWGRWFDQVLSK
jgi:hypothetical protein